MEINEILNSNDLRELLNISKNKLTRLTKQGLPYIQMGGETRIFIRDSLLRWLSSLEQPKREYGIF